MDYSIKIQKGKEDENDILEKSTKIRKKSGEKIRHASRSANFPSDFIENEKICFNIDGKSGILSRTKKTRGGQG